MVTHFWKNEFFTIFRNVPAFFKKILRWEWKWQKFIPKSEISADPIFLRSDAMYHILDSSISLFMLLRNCDKNNFSTFLRSRCDLSSFPFVFFCSSIIFLGKSWQRICVSSYKNLCLTAKPSYCHQESLLRGFRTFFFDIKRKKLSLFYFSEIWNRRDIHVLVRNGLLIMDTL